MTLLAVVHIPRTGGGSALSAISQHYGHVRGPGNVQIDPERTAATLRLMSIDPWLPAAVGDHVPYGLFRRYLPPETRYVTFLRDPVERVLSHYWFHARKGERKLAWSWSHVAQFDSRLDLNGVAGYTLEEGLSRGIPFYKNLAVRFLSGSESIYGPLPPGASKRARKNVSRFFFVGITERLDESLVLLGRALGVGPMPYRIRHVNTTKPVTDDALRTLVENHNLADVALYREARKRFDQLAAATPGLAEDAAALRAESERLSAEADEQDQRTASAEPGPKALRRWLRQ